MKKTNTFVFLLLCFSLASQELEKISAFRDTTLNMSDNEFKELEQKLERDDPTFRFKFLSENNVSYFIAAQKKRPQSLIWIELINMSFAGEKFNAGKLKNDNERKLLYENTLHYLSKSLIILENGNYPDNNDSIKRVYNTYKGMIKEDIAFVVMGVGEFDKVK